MNNTPTTPPDPKPHAAMNNRRTGKIARLPAGLRQQVNEYLSQGWEYSRIIDWLTQAGHPGVFPANLTNWRQGGYVDWLNHCQRLEELEIKLNYAREIALQADPAQFQQAAVNLTCLQFFELLNRFEPAGLAGVIQARPEKYSALINSLAYFTREYVGLERFRLELEDRAKIEAARTQTIAAGLDDAAVEQMLQALRLRILAQQNLKETLPAVLPNPSADPDLTKCR